MSDSLEFEKPLIELEEKIRELRIFSQKNDIDVSLGISLLEEKVSATKQHIFQHLTPMEKVLLARHPKRPRPRDFIKRIFTDFMELKGDRRFADDQAIIGGFARLGERQLVLIASQKGSTLKESIKLNFGCAHPEGYRKALRIMRLAEKARLPIVSLVDTPGAYPGIASEERHIGEAIACNLREMFRLSVPVLSIITGEGGSGGALGISVANRVLIMANAYYSVITPEGCAAILWRDPAAVEQAAQALKLTSADLLKIGVVDAVVPEPLGAAHSDHEAAAIFLKQAIVEQLEQLEKLNPQELLEDRYQKFRNLGIYLS